MFILTRAWWSNGKARHLAGLFAFEFLVVVAGVLAAQWVGSQAAASAAFSHMEDERTRARAELEQVHSYFLSWRAAAPCLEQSMVTVMTGARPALSLRRPSLLNPSYSAPDDQAMVLLGRRYGQNERQLLKGLASNVANLRAITPKIVESWGRLRLLDPANGPVTAADRLQARIAAADVSAQLQSASIVSRNAIERLTALKIPSRNREDPGFGPAQSCAAIWASGRLDPPLTMR